jgi:hypothetical protein
MQTKPFSNRRTARDVSLQFAWKGQHVLPTKDTTCRFAAIFEKLGVAVMARNFMPFSAYNVFVSRLPGSDWRTWRKYDEEVFAGYGWFGCIGNGHTRIGG